MKNLHNALLLKQLYQLKELGYKYTNSKLFDHEENNNLELPNSLEELKHQAQNCHLCSLSKSRNSVVFGEGLERSRLFFIGDSPLEQEDNEGKIFLGRSGEMLTAMIEKVLGLSRNEVYISNLLKCRPNPNLKNLEEASHTCKAYLFKEIELVQPQIIVTLGEEAYHYLTNDKSRLETIRGSVINYPNYKIVPTYHPNFLLKNPSLKKEALMDLKKVKSLL